VALRNALEHNPAVVYKGVFIGETIDVIERHDWMCDVLDFDVDGVSLTKIIEILSGYPDLMLLWAEVHHAQLAKQVALLCREVSPDTRIFVFGRGSTFIPRFYSAHPFDYAHVSGDREAAISSVLTHLDGQRQRLAGVRASEVHDPALSGPGEWMEAAKWPYPRLSRLPLEKYSAFTELVHGTNYSKRIAVTVSKGCSWGCAYCGATEQEGASDRRRDVSSILDWIQSTELSCCESLVHLYASDLFADPIWIGQFCDMYRDREMSFGWRGVTTTKTLQDEQLILKAGHSGCKELAIGIEHISRQRNVSVKSSTDEIRSAVVACARAGISLKGLVMLGYPGQTEDDVLYIEELAAGWGMTIRYTGYTPLHRLRSKSNADLSLVELNRFDRRTYFDSEKSSMRSSFFYEKISKNGGYFYPPGGG